MDRWSLRFGRFALAAAFLSAVASRLGLWGQRGGGWAQFESYAMQVNGFMPAFLHPFLARAATVCEVGLGLALHTGRPTTTKASSTA